MVRQGWLVGPHALLSLPVVATCQMLAYLADALGVKLAPELAECLLTGVITGLVAQGLLPFDAARAGVYLHGLAGDLAAERLGQVSLIAGDLVEWLPAAILRASDERGLISDEC